MSDELELYWVSGSPYSWRVTLTLAAKGVSYRSHLLKPDEGDFDDPGFRKISPRGVVPVLVAGDVKLAESLAIMAYVDQRFPEPSLFGGSPDEIGIIWAQMLEFVDYLEPFSKRIVKTLYAGKEREHRDELMACAETVRTELARIEQQLGGGWVLGGRMSAADFAIYPFLKSLFRVAAKPPAAILNLRILPIERCYPNMDAWMQAIEQLPYYDSTYPPGWRGDAKEDTS